MIVIGITGFSGSGKSYLAKIIENQYKNEVLIISQDNYYRGCFNTNPDEFNFDTLDAIDIDKLYEDITSLKKRICIGSPIYDFKRHVRVGYSELHPKKIILLEGHLIFLDSRIRNATDLLIYLDVDVDVALLRRIKRDILLRGRDLSEVINRYQKFVKDAHKKIECMKADCDIIIPHHKHNAKALDVILAYINKQLGD